MVNSKNYICIAVAVITNQNDDLLTVRKIGSDYFQLPGGKIDALEKPITALLRELKEELNLDLDAINFNFVGLHEAQAVNEIGKTVRGYIFRCKEDLELNWIKPCAELEEVFWVNKNNVEKVRFANLLKQYALPIWLTKNSI